MIRSDWLAVFLFAIVVVSGVWIGSLAAVPFAWLAALAVVGVLAAFPFALDAPEVQPPPPGARDVVGTLAVAAPALLYLGATWRQEFPQNGDQAYHNGAGAEALAVLWPWWWIAAVVAIVVVIVCVRRGVRLAPLIALAAVALAGLAFHHPYSFATRYPGTLHFFAAPLRALPLASPMNAERLLNVAAIPAWLLILRPRLLGRRVDLFALAAGALLLWQKDDVYFFSSGYLEPWAIVLLLTAAEHLARFGATALWRPLLLLGAAAMVKEHVVIALPIVAAVFFPKEKRLQYAAVVAAALAPFLIFSRLRGALRPWSAAWPDFAGALSPAHLAAFTESVRWQFGVALPVVALALLALLFLATRGRPFLALFLVALADAAFFFFARIQQPWPGYARTNLVPLALAAVAAGTIAERLAARSRAAAAALVAVIAAANAIPLLPFLHDAFRPDTARNFVEHSDAPIFYPLREALAQRVVAPGQRVRFVNNGKWTFGLFYPGPVGEQYPDLAARYRIEVVSFRGATERCRCTSSDVAVLAGFIRFENLGRNLPQRGAIEQEAAQCRQELARTCTQMRPVVHDGVVVGLVGLRP